MRAVYLLVVLTSLVNIYISGPDGGYEGGVWLPTMFRCFQFVSLAPGVVAAPHNGGY